MIQSTPQGQCRPPWSAGRTDHCALGALACVHRALGGTDALHDAAVEAGPQFFDWASAVLCTKSLSSCRSSSASSSGGSMCRNATSNPIDPGTASSTDANTGAESAANTALQSWLQARFGSAPPSPTHDHAAAQAAPPFPTPDHAAAKAGEGSALPEPRTSQQQQQQQQPQAAVPATTSAALPAGALALKPLAMAAPADASRPACKVVLGQVHALCCLLPHLHPACASALTGSLGGSSKSQGSSSGSSRDSRCSSHGTGTGISLAGGSGDVSYLGIQTGTRLPSDHSTGVCAGEAVQMASECAFEMGQGAATLLACVCTHVFASSQARPPVSLGACAACPQQALPQQQQQQQQQQEQEQRQQQQQQQQTQLPLQGLQGLKQSARLSLLPLLLRHQQVTLPSGRLKAALCVLYLLARLLPRAATHAPDVFLLINSVNTATACGHASHKACYCQP